MAGQVRTVALTPAVAAAAVALPKSFPGDPMDRIIYATAAEHGWPLITKDERMRRHSSSPQITFW
jgi:PIN domain nuclease of toxin-antitoxin system